MARFQWFLSLLRIAWSTAILIMRYTPVRSYQCWDGNPSPIWFKIPRLLSGIAMKKQFGESNLAPFYIYIYLQVLGRNKLTVSAITQGGLDLAFSSLAFPSLSMVRQWFWAPYQSGLSVPGRYSPSSSFSKYFSISSGVVWGNSWKWIFLVWFYYIVCGLPTSLYCFGSM